MIFKNKRGLSPIIATTLLILIAVIIAVIIFLWVKNFIGEKIQKDVGSGPEAIENFCKDGGLQFVAVVTYDASAKIATVTAQNNGNIPIYGIQLQKKGFASVKNIGSGAFVGPLTSGSDASVDIPTEDISAGDNVRVVAVLLGELQNGGGKKEYACGENYIEVEVTN